MCLHIRTVPGQSPAQVWDVHGSTVWPLTCVQGLPILNSLVPDKSSGSISSLGYTLHSVSHISDGPAVTLCVCVFVNLFLCVCLVSLLAVVMSIHFISFYFWKHKFNTQAAHLPKGCLCFHMTSLKALRLYLYWIIPSFVSCNILLLVTVQKTHQERKEKYLNGITPLTY